MRERTIATMVIWIASIVGIDKLISSIRYIEYVPNPNFTMPDLSSLANASDPMMIYSLYNSNATIPQTVWATGMWQAAVIGVIALIILMAGAATLAMWVNAHNTNTKAETRPSRDADETSKAKRRDAEREARIRYLLETMDDNELAQLEAGEFGSDGEPVSMEALLQRR